MQASARLCDHPTRYEESQAYDTVWYQMKTNGRTSMIIRCSPDDAAHVRNQAASDHRSVSGYLLYVLERSISIEDQYARGLTENYLTAHARSILGLTHDTVRTAIHLRCTEEQASKIRRCAARRQLSISDFVLFSLRRLWGVRERLRHA